MLNPYVILALVLMVVGAGGSGYLKGRLDQKNATIAAQTKQRTLNEAIERGVAEGVSQIKVQHTTVRQKLETIVRENTHYVDCRHDPAALGLLNDLLTGEVTKPVGDRVVPKADAAP